MVDYNYIACFRETPINSIWLLVSKCQVVLFWLLVSGMTIILCCLKCWWFCNENLLLCYCDARDTHFSALVIIIIIIIIIDNDVFYLNIFIIISTHIIMHIHTIKISQINIRALN